MEEEEKEEEEEEGKKRLRCKFTSMSRMRRKSSKLDFSLIHTYISSPKNK